MKNHHLTHVRVEGRIKNSLNILTRSNNIRVGLAATSFELGIGISGFMKAKHLH
jgi:hypothetical protein